MEIINNGTTLEVEPGAFIYDETTDTYAEWDSLDSTTQQRLNGQIDDLKALSDSIQLTIGNAKAVA